MTTDILPGAIVQGLLASGQGHLLEHAEHLDANVRRQLVQNLEGLDFERLAQVFKASTSSQAKLLAGDVFPVSGISTVKERTAECVSRWRAAGLQAIGSGQLAVLLLAGGQGTRLGSSAPKGCYDIGLPSRKSLFQLQAERLLRMQHLACNENDRSTSSGAALLPLYIMTSVFTHDEIRAFFATHGFFGLNPEQVLFFQQGQMPCFTRDGKLVVETQCQLARAPDGNGGVFSALEESGMLLDMERRGVRFCECFAVDNALVRVADPLFLGHFLQSGAPLASKVVRKAYPEERVGVFVHKGHPAGPVEVVEYSELPEDLATSLDPDTGRLRFLWSNVCMHLFSLDFLKFASAQLKKDPFFHPAWKTIPSLNGPVPGVKLEQFIFDPFRFAPSMALFEVLREEEFSPVKNAPGSSSDSPDTARAHLLALHRRWVEAAGGRVDDGEGTTPALAVAHGGVEVSPLLSHSGEGLEQRCAGQSFSPGVVIDTL
eukprot:TRINITY_DN17960_c0_g3_i1.p1 TRINITY_DN17960_c0_g3~~TRINITY_DN17960_c0_g3_i1.p1  ORF type:complete len:487 (-),score=91.59 TRINITY_DN17960_c0_g3_i1:659-2119(-)